MLATAITGKGTQPSAGEFSPGRFGYLADELLTEQGIWQYAHYYDPASASGPLRTLAPETPGAPGLL